MYRAGSELFERYINILKRQKHVKILKYIS
jgi:hypothetical protein